MAAFNNDLQSYLLYLLVLISCFQRHCNCSEIACEAGPCGLGQYYNPGASVQAPDNITAAPHAGTTNVICFPCPDSTFMSLDNHSCSQCRTCSQADSSLFQEVEHSCTPSSDAEVGCKEGYTRSRDDELCIPSTPVNDVTSISFSNPHDDKAKLGTISKRPIDSISTDNPNSQESELKLLGGDIKNTSEMLDPLQVQINQVTPAFSDQSGTSITDIIAKSISSSNVDNNGAVSNTRMTIPDSPDVVLDDNFTSKKPSKEESTTVATPRHMAPEKDAVMTNSNLSSSNMKTSRILNQSDTVQVDSNDIKLVTFDPSKKKTEISTEQKLQSSSNDSYDENVKTNIESNTISAGKMFNITKDINNITTVLRVSEVVKPTKETFTNSHPSQESLSEESTKSSEASSGVQSINHTPEEVGRLKSPPVTNLSNTSVEQKSNLFLNQSVKGIPTVFGVATAFSSGSKGNNGTMEEIGGDNYSFKGRKVEGTGESNTSPIPGKAVEDWNPNHNAVESNSSIYFNQTSWEELHFSILPTDNNVTSLKNTEMYKEVGEIHSSSDEKKTLNVSSSGIPYEGRPDTSTVSNIQENSIDKGKFTGTFNNTDQDNSTGTYNNTDQDNSTGTYNSTDQGNGTGTYNSTDQGNGTGTYNSTDQGNGTGTYNSSDQDNSTGTYNSTDHDNVTGTYNIAGQANIIGTYNNTSQDNSTGTYNSASQDNIISTYNNTSQDNSTGTYNSTGLGTITGIYSSTDQDNIAGTHNNPGQDNSTGKYNGRDIIKSTIEGKQAPALVLYTGSSSDDDVNIPGTLTIASSGDRSENKPCYSSETGGIACGNDRQTNDDKSTRSQNNGENRNQNSGPERNQFVHDASPHNAGFIVMLVILNLMLAIGLFICIMFTVRFRKSLKLAFCPNKNETKNIPAPIEETEMPLIISKA